MKPEKFDNVNKPRHYQGSKGLESIEVIDNFIGNLPGKAAWCWGNAIKYLLRFQKKNGLEEKTSNDAIINVNSAKHSVTIEGVEFGSDCSALVSKNKDGTGTITLIFEGKII